MNLNAYRPSYLRGFVVRAFRLRSRRPVSPVPTPPGVVSSVALGPLPHILMFRAVNLRPGRASAVVPGPLRPQARIAPSLTFIWAPDSRSFSSLTRALRRRGGSSSIGDRGLFRIEAPALRSGAATSAGRCGVTSLPKLVLDCDWRGALLSSGCGEGSRMGWGGICRS